MHLRTQHTPRTCARAAKLNRTTSNTRSIAGHSLPARALGDNGPLPLQNVQIFGVKNSPATRAAERFFKERRIPIHFVDLKQKPMAPGEIKRFLDKFTLAGLIDTEGKAYADAGLKYLRVSDPDMLRKIEDTPLLLKLPLIRGGKLIAIGHDETTWKAMLTSA